MNLDDCFHFHGVWSNVCGAFWLMPAVLSVALQWWEKGNEVKYRSLQTPSERFKFCQTRELSHLLIALTAIKKEPLVLSEVIISHLPFKFPNICRIPLQRAIMVCKLGKCSDVISYAANFHFISYLTVHV